MEITERESRDIRYMGVSDPSAMQNHTGTYVTVSLSRIRLVGHALGLGRAVGLVNVREVAILSSSMRIVSCA
jgi:hypothetical protein